jgi:peptidyl-prolyl cis-trans isomerase B (cyclophilin B)
MVAFADVAVRLGVADRVTTPPAGLRVSTPEAMRAWGESLGIAGTERAREELAGLFAGKGAPPEVRARIELARPQLYEALVRSTAKAAPDEALALLESSYQMIDRRLRESVASLRGDKDLALPVTDATLDGLARLFDAHRDSEPGPGIAALDAVHEIAPGEQGRWVHERGTRHFLRLVRLRALKYLGTAASDFATVGGYNPGMASRLAPGVEDLDFYGSLAERSDKLVVARIRTRDHGDFGFALFPQEAPMTVANFVRLAQTDFFDGLSFHRVVPNFVIQGGDPRNDMRGGPNYTIPCEINTLPFEAGTLGMAHAGKDTGGSQFFVTLTPQARLEGGYTVFGRMLTNPADLPDHPEFAAVQTDVARLDRIAPYAVIEDVEILEASR